MTQRARPTTLALSAALVPLVAANLSYATGAALTHLPLCFTYIHGCTSMSATGRALPEAIIYRSGMLAGALFAAATWLNCARFLALDADVGRRRLLAPLGVIASIAMLALCLSLGVAGDFFALLRRLASSSYFLATFSAQCLFVLALRRVAMPGVQRYATVLQTLCIVMLGLGVLNLAIGSIEERTTRKMIQNIVAWNYALLTSVFFVVLSGLFRSSHFTVPTR